LQSPVFFLHFIVRLLDPSQILSQADQMKDPFVPEKGEQSQDQKKNKNEKKNASLFH
jgi:hypothetical protein